jgi:hypothetical protein
LPEAVQKLADLAAAKKSADFEKQARALAENGADNRAVMNLMGYRKRGGIGFGTKPPEKADGIEAKLLDMIKTPLTPAQVEAQAVDLERMGYQVAAIAEVVQHFENKKDWKGWSIETKTAALEFADAARAKKDEDLAKALRKMLKACGACHNDYK